MKKNGHERFLSIRGRAAFAKLIAMFEANRSGPEIAEQFGVTRQRVHQWKRRFGRVDVRFVARRGIKAARKK